MSEYNILADMHTHTVASTHAYSTVVEMARYAKLNGLDMVAITDHGPKMYDAPKDWHFFNMRIFPKMIEGVVVVPGIEANIITEDGKLDMPQSVLEKMPWVIASCHKEVIRPTTFEDHTNMWRAVARNPVVDVIGHCGQQMYYFDYELVIQKFKKYNKIIELNNSSVVIRPDSSDNCLEIAELCKKYEVMVCVNSDAHICFEVGKVQNVQKILKDINFPEELIINTSAEKVAKYLKDKKGLDYFAE